MATIESKNLLVWVKAMSRGQALPLDASEIYDSYDAAVTYAASATAYAGQTIKALKDGKYVSYVLQPSDAGYVLEEVGAVKASDLKQYVVVVESLPAENQEQGMLYIDTVAKKGYIWNGTDYVEVFADVNADIAEVKDDIKDVNDALDLKAPLANPVFSGTVKVGTDEVALKSYVDGLIGNLTSCAPGIVDSSNALPEADYKAGQTFRVAEAGEYAGNDCEVGDLIIVVKDYNVDSASESDFMVVQANIDGAITTAVESATVGEIVVFDAVTGRVVKGSGINIASLQEVIDKMHEHSNKTILDSYDKTQSELLAAAKTEAEGLVNTLSEVVDGKADKATTLEGYGITNAYTSAQVDALLSPITENLNTKVDAATVDSKIAEAKTETLEEAAAAANEALESRVGAIPADTTIQSYIDTAVGSGGTASAQAIATAKQEAIDASKLYTDEQLAAALTVVQF